MKSDLSALKNAASAAGRHTDAEAIRIGPTLCLLGVPRPSEEGTVALVTGPGVMTDLADADIVEVDKEPGDRYLVEERADATLVVRSEHPSITEH